MAKPYISAFHAGATSVTPYIQADQLIYWYRINLRALDCDATDTTMVPANNASGNYFEGRPNGWQDMADSIFVVAMLTSPGTVTIVSGSNERTFNAPAGATAFAIDMQVGQQQFFLTRNGATILSAVSLMDITNVCKCGIYNFNAYVGTVPDGPVDQLQHDGLASLTAGLHVNTCSATPSLGTVPIKPTITPPNGGPPPSTSQLSSPSTTTAPPPPPLSTSTISPPPPPPTSTTTSMVPTGTCNAGTGPGNYIGLCQFDCNYDYCPSPCTCTSYSAAVAAPPSNGVVGIPSLARTAHIMDSAASLVAMATALEQHAQHLGPHPQVPPLPLHLAEALYASLVPDQGIMLACVTSAVILAIARQGRVPVLAMERKCRRRQRMDQQMEGHSLVRITVTWDCVAMLAIMAIVRLLLVRQADRHITKERRDLT